MARRTACARTARKRHEDLTRAPARLPARSPRYAARVFRLDVRLAAFALMTSALLGCLDTTLPTPMEPPGQSDAGPTWCFVLPEVIDFGEVEPENLDNLLEPRGGYSASARFPL